MKGYVFNIQPYSIHDGPGIRTTVFIKGCPLRCIWCQNPESQIIAPQLMVHSSLCTKCGICISACLINAIHVEGSKASTDRDKCSDCGSCAKVCPTKARELVGEEMCAEDVAKKACADKIFFNGSGGGVTLSGGEALSQPEFSREILRLCKANDVHTAIETCGFAEWDSVKKTLEFVDLVLYDIKHMNSSIHKQSTGIGNELILQNVVKIKHELGKEVIVRIPVIANLNDSFDNIKKTAIFVATELGLGTAVYLLPYNPLGESKSESLELRDIPHFDAPSTEHLDALKAILDEQGLKGIIGG